MTRGQIKASQYPKKSYIFENSCSPCHVDFIYCSLPEILLVLLLATLLKIFNLFLHWSYFPTYCGVIEKKALPIFSAMCWFLGIVMPSGVHCVVIPFWVLISGFNVESIVMLPILLYTKYYNSPTCNTRKKCEEEKWVYSHTSRDKEVSTVCLDNLNLVEFVSENHIWDPNTWSVVSLEPWTNWRVGRNHIEKRIDRVLHIPSGCQITLFLNLNFFSLGKKTLLLNLKFI